MSALLHDAAQRGEDDRRQNGILTLQWTSSFGLIFLKVVSRRVRTTSSSKADKLNSPVDASRMQIPKDVLPDSSDTCSLIATQWFASSVVRYVGSTIVPLVNTCASSLRTILSCAPPFVRISLLMVSMRYTEGKPDPNPPDSRLCLLNLADLVSCSQELGGPKLEALLRDTDHTHLDALCELEVKVSVADPGVFLVKLEELAFLEEEDSVIVIFLDGPELPLEGAEAVKSLGGNMNRSRVVVWVTGSVTVFVADVLGLNEVEAVFVLATGLSSLLLPPLCFRDEWVGIARGSSFNTQRSRGRAHSW